jgi:hypothetical protein
MYSLNDVKESGWVVCNGGYSAVEGHCNHHIILEHGKAFALGWIRVSVAGKWVSFQGKLDGLNPHMRLTILELCNDNAEEVLWCDDTDEDDPEERGISRVFQWPTERREFIDMLLEVR